MHVLIVDDNAMNRRLPILILQAERGITSAEADSGASALEQLARQRADVVLLDISMPQENGVEVCRKIRQMAIEPPPRIVAYTAHAMIDEIGEFLQQGFDAVLVKPVNRANVMKALGL